MPFPCRAAKGLECVFPIWFTQCGRVWFTLAMPCPCHAPTMPFFSRLRHSNAVYRQPCCTVALRRTAWSEHGMTSVNQTRPHCVNQMGKTHSKPLAARHGRGTAWALRAMCESALTLRIAQRYCNLVLKFRNLHSFLNPTTLISWIFQRDHLWLTEIILNERRTSFAYFFFSFFFVSRLIFLTKQTFRKPTVLPSSGKESN